MNPAGQTVSSDISWASQANMKHWDEVRQTPIGKLKLAEALLGRIGVGDWSQRRIRMEELKGRVGPYIREADPVEAMNDPGIVGMIRELFGEPGVNRLKARAQQKVLSSTDAVRQAPGQQPQGNNASPAESRI